MKNNILLYIIIILLAVSLFNNNGYLKKYISDKIDTKKQALEDVKKDIDTYTPTEEYNKKIDSLNKEINKLKSIDYEKKRIIYINSDFDAKYKLLTDKMAKDTIQ